MSKRFKIIFGIVIAIIVIYAATTASIATTSKHFIIITYFDNNNEKTAYATEIIEQDKNCIKFKNQFGLEESICAQNIHTMTLK